MSPVLPSLRIKAPIFPSRCRSRRALLFATLFFTSVPQSILAAEWSEALQKLCSADAGQDSQIEKQRAWHAVTTTGTVEQIPEILAAMKGVSPLAENWLRAAVDTLAEGALAEKRELPRKALEEFVFELKQSPRARRVAYEWLIKVDKEAASRILPKVLDDPSLELRYDAVDYLLTGAGFVGGTQNKIKMYQRALQSARDISQLRTCAESLKELGYEPKMAEELGFLTSWKVIGPFSNDKREGFDKSYPPESEIQLTGEYAGNDGPVKWLDVEAVQDELEDIGKVDLNSALVMEKSILAYAYTTVESKQEQWVELRYESVQATKLWVNGKEVAAQNVYHSGDGFDQYIVSCQLRQGENQILIKVCQNEQTEPWTKPWEFRLRVTDKLGGAISFAQKPMAPKKE